MFKFECGLHELFLFTHWWQRLPCKVPTGSGAIWGSVSCSRTLWHAARGSRDSNQWLITGQRALPPELQPPQTLTFNTDMLSWWLGWWCYRMHRVALLSALYQAGFIFLHLCVCVWVNKMWFGYWLNYCWSKGCAVDEQRERDEDRRNRWHDKAWRLGLGTVRRGVGQPSNWRRERRVALPVVLRERKKKDEYRVGGFKQVN